MKIHLRLALLGFVLITCCRLAADAPPSAREYHTAVWTGTEVLIWGGINSGGPTQTGSRLNPTTNTWSPISTIGAPSARYAHTAVWTGTEMIVWGGNGGIPQSQNAGSPLLNDGGSYNPVTDTWTAIPSRSNPFPPIFRIEHTAIWTGTEMIVWGGNNGSVALSDGGRYNPVTKAWTAITRTGAPISRYNHTAVWTGSEMIIWGGEGNSSYFNDGGRYNPASDSWTTVSSNAAPSVRMSHTAVWTGNEMIVWGGVYNSALNDGGRYNAATDSWTSVSVTNVPVARSQHTAIWSGSEMIVWGGYTGINTVDGIYLGNGGRYVPTTNTWNSLSLAGAPPARSRHTAVRTNSEMIVWGGVGSRYFSDGGRYNPSADLWTEVMGAGVPVPTSALTATGTYGVAFSGYQITATNAPTYFLASGLPTGLVLNPTMGVISGKPTVSGIFSVTIGAGSEEGSNTATLELTVNQAPTIGTQPVNQTPTLGTPVTFSVVAFGFPVLSYQWKKDGVNIVGATDSSYTIATVTAGDAGSYSNVVTNSVGSVTSYVAVLTPFIEAPSNAVISITIE